ncbi:cysteine desulfurase [Acuticoccus sediminis]|uniref:Cysteine desulfurase n=1 Tax=Acuticoccus sediminis TaxID=2184697 RepID=A0A8B2NTP6_9HYPH|nr:cysteine desulfurase [Acuticoccus sediminis]RAI00625.1 cysteine desulfurase [Acuticoccus sediminis]
MDITATADTLDIERIRADFPILSQTIHGKPLVYLDSAASAQKPTPVLNRIMQAYSEDYANVHRGLHTLANRSTEAYEGAREIVRRFINAPSTEEVIFTRSSTEAINLVAGSYGRTHIGEGDEIVITVMEHHSNVVPWHFLRERQGAVIRWVGLREDGSLDMDEFEAALSERTRMVAVVHMSNVLGTVNPVAEICRIARERGIATLVDGSQSTVHGPVDVQAIGCDFFAFTGHKLYGPTGIGVLYGRREMLEGMPPFLGGGEMIESVSREAITYAGLPNRFEAGTPPIVQAIGLGAAIEYVESIGWDAITAHEASLTAYARERLRGVNALSLYGDAPNRGGVFAFNLEGAHPHDVSTILDREGVAVRAGQHCTEPLMEALGINASCRASFGLYNTRAEVDRLAEAIEKAHRFFV